MAAISAAAAADRSAFDDYARDAATEVVTPLSHEYFTHEAPGVSDLQASDIFSGLSEDGRRNHLALLTLKPTTAVACLP